MRTPEQCEGIIRRMLALANEGHPVTLEADWGGYSATVVVNGAHTHVGLDEGMGGTWEQFVFELYNSLHGGPGLSWVKEVGEPDAKQST